MNTSDLDASTSATKYGRLGAWLALCIAFAVVFACIYPLERALPAMLLFLVVVSGIVLAPRRLWLASWSAGIPLFYALFFLILPLANRLIGLEDSSEDSKIAAALYVTVAGMVSFIIGTRAVRFLRYRDTFGLVGLDARLKTSSITWLIAVGAGATVWSYFFGYFGLLPAGEKATGVAGIASTFGGLLTVGHVLAWNAYFKGRRTLRVALLATAVMLVAGLFANSKWQILLPLVLVALSYWSVTGKIPYKLGIACVLLYVVVVFPLVTASRFALVAVASQYNGARANLGSLMLDYAVNARWEDSIPKEYNAVQSMGRGLLPYFATIVDQTGRSVPYMSGRTIVDGMAQLIPRVVYSDKPDMSIGNWTGQAFGVVAAKDSLTNVSPTYMGEFYMNFGLMGVCAGMFLVGLLAVFVDRRIMVERSSWTMPLAVAALRWQESFLGHTILPFLKTVFVVLAVYWAAKLVIPATRRAHHAS